MKKCLLFLTMLAASMIYATPSMSAIATDYVGIYVEHRSYDANFFSQQDRYYTSIWWEGGDFGTEAVTKFDVTFNGTPYPLTEDTSMSGVWSLPAGTKGFYGSLGYTNDSNAYSPSNWEGDYYFDIESGAGNLSFTHTVPAGAFSGIPDIPTVADITGNLVTWNPVAGADRYRVRLLDPSDWGNLIYQSGNITDTFLDLTGLVAAGTYVLRIEAKDIEFFDALKDGIDNPDYHMVSRGTYFSQVTVTPVPGAGLMLGSALVALVGFTRRRG